MVAEVASIQVSLTLLGVDKFQAGMRGSATISEQTGSRVSTAMDRVANSGNKAGKAIEGMSRGDGALRSVAISALRAETSVLALSKAFTLVGTAVGGLAGGVAANAFKNYADSATTIANKLAVVVPIQQQRAAIDKEIFDTAQRTRTSYESTTALFSRMSLSSKELGASQKDILRVTETTQKALKTGGATSGEAASIATQLTQALGSGRGLAGDELKSIAENAPVLLQAIATEFGVTTGDLKDMGEKGQLAADRVFQAILKAGTEIDRVFKETTPTIADGIQQIDNALTRYIGAADKSLGASKILGNGLKYVADNMNGIGDGVAVAVAGIAGSLLGRGTSKGFGAITAPFAAARKEAQDALKAAKEMQAARFEDTAQALQGSITAALRAKVISETPSLSLAGPKALADLLAAEKRMEGQRTLLADATKKVADAEKYRNEIATASSAVSKKNVNAEERAQGRLENRRRELEMRIREYAEAAPEISKASGSLSPKNDARYRAALAEREELNRKLAEVDARSAAAQGQLAGMPGTTTSRMTRERAAAAAALTGEIEKEKAERLRVGRELQSAIRAANDGEEALQAVNNAALTKAAGEVERIGARLVAAESAVVAARQDLAKKAAATASGGAQARSASSTIRAIEEEIRAQERLEKATKNRDTLSATYLDKAARAPNVGGSLSAAQVKALSEARAAREFLSKELDAIDAQIAAKTAQRDRTVSSINPQGARNITRDAANEARRSGLNDALDKAAAERAEIAKNLDRVNGVIVTSEKTLAERTATARQSAIAATVAAGARLRDVQTSLANDLTNLNARRKAVIENEVANEETRARRLMEIDKQITETKRNQKGIQQAVDQNAVGVQRARDAVRLDAEGKGAEAIRAQLDAEAAVVASRKASVEVASAVARAERMAGTLGIVKAAAGAAGSAFSGLVSMLGGPLGAALTIGGVAMAGYSIYQARAAAEAEKHADALKNLTARTLELQAAQAAGKPRTEGERQDDAMQTKDALRGVRDIRNRALDVATVGFNRAERASASFGDDSMAERGPNAVERAAGSLGVSYQDTVRQLKELPAGSVEAGKALQTLADIMTEAARINPQYAKNAQDLRGLSVEGQKALEITTARLKAEEAQVDIDRRARSRKAVYDADEGGPIIQTPKVSTEETKAKLDEIEAYAKTVGESISKIGEGGIKVPELDTLRTQFQEAVQGLAQARVQAEAVLSKSFSAPTDVVQTVQAYKSMQISVEEYATKLQALKESNPNFAPLIDSLIAAANQGLNASSVMQGLESRIAGLDGRTANMYINVITRSIGQVRAEDAKAVADQDAAGEKALLNKASSLRVKELEAKGDSIGAKVLQAQMDTPGIDPAETRRLAVKEASLDAQIAANAKAARGGGRKKGGGGAKQSQEQKDAKTLAEKLQELDQDANVSTLGANEEKTVRFAQSAKVATDQINQFIEAAKSGNLKDIPPTMQEIYDKVKKLAGVKLAESALDEIFPARKLTRDLESLKAAADASPEIAANLGLIEMKLRADAAPEWGKSLTTTMSETLKSVLNGSSSIGSALEKMRDRIVNLALDAALKPGEQALNSFFATLGKGGNMGGLGSFFSSLFGGGGGNGLGSIDGAPVQGPPAPAGYAAGVTSLGEVYGPGTGTSDSILAMLSKGESVINAKATQDNKPLIAAMNAGKFKLPKFAGGMLDGRAAEMGGALNRVGNTDAAAALRSSQQNPAGAMKVSVSNTGTPKNVESATVDTDGEGRRQLKLQMGDVVAVGSNTPQGRRALSGRRTTKR